MGKCWCLLYTAPDLNRMVFQCTSILKSPESTILCHFDKIQWGGVELFAAIYLSSQWHVLNFINLFFFPPYVCSDRLEYPTGPRRLQVHGSVNLNVAKLWVNSHDFLFTYYFLFYHLPANVHTSFSDSFFNFAALSLCFIYNNSFLPITFLPTLPSALFLFLIPSMPPHLSFSPMFLSNHPLLTPSFFLFFYLSFSPSFFCFSLLIPFVFLPVELRWRGRKHHHHSADDLPEAAELRGTAELLLCLPSVRGLVRRQGWQLWQGAALPGLQRRGDVLRQ